MCVRERECVSVCQWRDRRGDVYLVILSSELIKQSVCTQPVHTKIGWIHGKNSEEKNQK